MTLGSSPAPSRASPRSWSAADEGHEAPIHSDEWAASALSALRREREALQPLGKFVALRELEPARCSIKKILPQRRIGLQLRLPLAVFCVKVALANFITQVFEQRVRPSNAIPRPGPVGLRLRFSREGASRIQPRARHSILILALRITLAHFSVELATSLPNSAGPIGIGSAPRSANFAFIP